MFWLIVRGRTHAFGLVDVLIISVVRFVIRFVELIILFDFYFIPTKIVIVEYNSALVVGILNFLLCFFHTLGINADYLV